VDSSSNRSVVSGLFHNEGRKDSIIVNSTKSRGGNWNIRPASSRCRSELVNLAVGGELRRTIAALVNLVFEPQQTLAVPTSKVSGVRNSWEIFWKKLCFLSV